MAYKIAKFGGSNLKDVHGINEIEIYDNISLIAAVGEGLISKYVNAGLIFTEVTRKGSNIKIICFVAGLVVV